MLMFAYFWSPSLPEAKGAAAHRVPVQMLERTWLG